jgi:hypothetical protein
MIRSDVAACLDEANALLDELEHIGLAYQATFRTGDQGTQATPSDLEKIRSRLENQFDKRMTPSPLPVIRALQIHGFAAASEALKELWDNVFRATSLLVMSWGIDDEEVLKFDVQGTADAARTALRKAREAASTEDHMLAGDEDRRAAAIEAALLVDAIARLGGDYQDYLADPDFPLPMGDDSDETNEEARLRTRQEFDALPISSVCDKLRLHGYEEQASSVAELESDVRSILSRTEADEEEPLDLYARRDAIAAQLRSASQTR